MSKKFKVIVNTGNADNNQNVEVTQGQGARGQAVRLKAKAGAKYQLLDLEKSKDVGPDYVKVKRVGKHLHILFEGSTEADVIIEDYYDVMPEGYNGVVGQAENGNFYEYIPEDPDVKGLIPQLADGGQAVSVALGGAEVVGSGAAVAILAFNPLLAGLGLLGAGAAAAAVGAGAAGTGAATADVAITSISDSVGNPNNGTVNLNAGGLTNDNTPTLTGRAPAGAVVTILDGQTVLGTTTADANGAWSFTPGALAEGNHNFTATAAVAGTPVTSDAFSIVVDTTAPTIAVSVPKNSLASGEAVTVTFTLSEASTDFVLADISVVGGTLSNFQGSGTNYTATFTPNAGVTSAAVFVDSDKFQDAAGNLNKDGSDSNNTASFSVGAGSVNNNTLAITSVTDNVSNTPEGAAIGIAAGGQTNDNTPTLNGTAPAGSVVTIREGNTVLGTATANAQGVWSFTPTALAEGPHSLSASTTVNGATTNAGPFAFTVDTAAPTITVATDKTVLANGETATLTFTLSEPSTDFQASDITSPSGAITNLQGVPGTGNATTGFTQYTATFTPNAGVASAAIVVSSDRFSDAAGNLNKDGADTNNAVSLAINTANTQVSIDNATDNVGNPNNGTVNLSNGANTNDTTPTLSGKAPAGTTVSIRDGNTVLGTATADANGNWTFTPQALAPGNHSFVATFTANGVTNTSNPYTLVIDTAAPTLQVSADTARLLNTGDTATVFFDLSEPSTDLTNADISLSGGTLSTLQGVPGTGNATSGFTRYAATFTKTTGTPTSVSVASGRFSDAAGNFNTDGADANNTWTFSATAATATSIGSVTDNVGNPNNAVENLTNGGKTNDTTPTLNGRGTPGEQVTIRDGNTVLGTTTVNPDGTWSFTPSPALSEGPHSFTASTPSGGTSAPFSVDIDTTAPATTAPSAPAITSVTDNVGSVTGDIAKGATSDDNTPTVSGTGTPGTTVTVFNGTTAVGTATVGTDGTWSLTTSALTGPAISLTARTTDTAGNTSPATGAYPYTLDTSAPAKLSFTATDNVGTTKGPIAAGSTTDDNTPTFSGTTEPGAMVTIKDGDTVLGTTTARPDGTWSFTPTEPLSNGPHSITETVTDPAGNTSPPSEPLNFSVDATAVTVSITKATDNVAANTGDLADNATTNDTTPTLVGKATANATVTVREGTTVVGTTTADANGNWSLTTPAQSNGVHNYTATASTATGASDNANFSLTVDADTPAAPQQLAITDDVGSVQGNVPNGGTTDDTTPTISGTGEAGSTITIRDGNTVLGTTTVRPDGTWSFTPKDPLAAGPHSITSTATDPAGNTGPASSAQTFTIDATGPSTTVDITRITEDTGVSNTDFITSDNNGLTVSATLSTALATGERLFYSRDNGATWTDITASVSGTTVSAVDSQLTSTATIRMQVRDAAGNAGATDSQLVTIDTSGSNNNGASNGGNSNGGNGGTTTDPNTSATVSITAISTDTGTSTSDFITSDPTLSYSGTVSGFTANGAAVQLVLTNASGTEVGRTFVTPATDGTWTWDNTGVSRASGNYTLTATVVDAAGNRTNTAAAGQDTQVVTIDTSAPSQETTDPLNPSAAAGKASITLDPVTADNIVNATEGAQANVAITGTARGEFTAGDTVTLTVNGKTFTGTVNGLGAFSINVPGADLLADSDKTIDASLAAKDAAGNTGTVTDTQVYTTDTTGPSTTVDITRISRDTGASSSDFITSDNDGLTVSATLSAALATGEKLFYSKDNGSTWTDITGSVNGTAVSHVDSTLTSTATVRMQVRDAADNAGATDSQLVTIDTTAPTQENTTPLNPSAAAGKASVVLDSITSDNLINAAEGAQANIAITGTARGDFTAGDTITLMVNGKTFTGTVNAQGAFSINVPGSDLRDAGTKTVTASLAATDVAGNVGTITDTQDYTVDTTGPSTTVNITAITNDTGVSNTDFITSDNNGLTVSATLSTALATGERLFYSKDDGVTWTDITASVSNNGTGTQVSHPDSTLTSTATLRMQVRDAAGNPGATDTQLVTIDTTAPTQEGTTPLTPAAGKASLVLDDVTADNTVSGVEGAQTNVAITGTARGDFTAGDVVTLTINGKTFTGEVAANGRFSINVRGADLLADSDKTIAATLDAHDAAGNFGPISARKTYFTDTTAPNDGAAPTVSITTDSNNDGWVSRSELGQSDTFSVRASFDNTKVVAGDKVIFNNGSMTETVTLSATDISNGFATINFGKPAEGGTLTVTAQLQDMAGNNGAVSASDSARLDTTGPAPIVSPESSLTPPAGKASLSIDNVTADNIVNLAESALTSVAITGTARGEFKAGDTVTLTVNGSNFTGTVNADGQYSINVSGANLKADGDKTIDATLTATDAAGNTGAITATKLYTLDDNTPNGGAAPTVEITTDANNDGVVSSNELGSSQNFAVKGSFDKTKVVAGDQLVFSNGTTTNTINLTQADIDAGFATTTFAKPTEGGTLTVTAVVRDIAGNTSASSTTDSARLDTTGPAQESTNPSSPAAGKTSLVLNDVTADNILSAAESGTTIAITGTARGEFKAGDTVTLTINSKTFTGTLTSGGTFSINVPGADLAADSDTNIAASLLATDAAGNTGTITATKDYSANTSAPNGGDAPTLTIDTDANNDGLVSFGEIGNTSGTPNTTLTVSAKFDSAKVAVGDTVTFTDTGTGTVKTVTLTQAMKDAGQASTTFTSPGDGVTFNVKASLTDGVLGNTGPEATDSATLDLSNLNPVSPSTKQGVAIRITTDADDNGILNTTEINGGTTASVTVTLPTDAKAGDVLVITGTGNDSRTITLSAAQIMAGSLTASFTLPANGSKLEVTARVTDSAGNTSNLATDEATVNTTPVGAPTVTITTDANNDGFINRSELNGASTVSVRTTLPTGAAVGDTITVTDGTTPKTHTLVQADLDAGFVTDSFTAPANGATLNVSATRTNSAGNVSSAGTDRATVDTSSFVDPTDATKTGLKVTLNTDTNNDGFISGAELTTQFTATVTLPGQAAAGDTITLSASGNNPRSITLTAAHITAGQVVVNDLTATGDGTTFTVSASITDRAGNTSPTPDASDSANIQSAAPNGGVAPTVEITTDDNNDGLVNATEIGNATTFTVKGSFDKTKVMAGDQIVFSDGSNTQTITLSAADIGNGFATTTFAKPAEGGTLTVTARLRDSLGNTTASSTSDSARLDTSAPNGELAPVVSITTDANNDGLVSAAELGNATTFAVRATFDKTKVVAGDILVFTDGAIVKMVTLTATDINNGFGSTTFDKPAEGATLQVSATVMDTAGNVASESDVDSAKLDTTGPAQETVNPNNPAAGKTSIALNAITGDDVINATEGAQTSIAITGRVRGEFTAGDTITLTVNGQNVTGQAAADGTFSINVSGANLLGDTDLTVAASLVAKDAAGNPGTITANRAYTLDGSAPNGGVAPTVTITTDTNNDGLVNATEIGTANTFAVRASFDKAKVAVGDKVLFSNGTTTNTVTLTQADIDAGFATTTYTKPSEGGTLSVTANVQDSAGNTSATSAADSAKLDTTGPLPVGPTESATNPPAGKTSLVLDSVTADNIVNTAEGAQASIVITGTVRGEFTTGDVVTLTINGKTFTGAVAANGTFSINTTGADLRADNDTTVAASLAAKDAAGNTGTITDDQKYSLDSTAPTTTVDITRITNDTGVSGTDFITSDNNGLTVSATLSAALATGEKLFYSKDNGTTWTDITGSVSGTAVSHVDSTLTSTATIQMRVEDAAGNPGAADSQLVTIDTTGPTEETTDPSNPAAGKASLVLDPVTADNVINATEGAQTNVAITGTARGEFTAGDVVTLTINGKTFTGNLASNGTFSINVPGSDLLADSDKTISAVLAAKDAAGNVGNVTDTQTYTTDATGPSTTVDITRITDDTGVSGTDFITNDNNGLTVSATLSAALATGEKLFYSKDNGVTWTDITGSVSGTNVSHADASLTATTTLRMQVRDAAGNPGATDTQLVTIDTTAPTEEGSTPLTPAAGKASLVLDSVTADNIVNATEGAQANVAITGTARGEFTAGDVVTLTVNGKNFTGTVAADGTFSINVPGADLLADGNKTIDASLAAKDTAGNVGNITDTQVYTTDASAPSTTVDITAITNDSGVSNTDFITNDNNGLTISATLSTALATGERLFYSKDNGVTWTDITASVSNNGTGTQVSHADATLTSTATLRMQVRDAAGNAGATDTQLVTIDTTGPAEEGSTPLTPAAGKASLVLDSVTSDNIVNAAEGAQANVAITGTARGDFTAGDVVTLTVNGKTFTGEVAGNGRFSINVSGADLLADSDKTIDASLAARDVAGNVGTVTDTQVFTTNTTGPTTTVDIIGITNDTGVSNNDFITRDSDGLTVSATLSAALTTGQKLFYSKDNGVTWTDITGSVSSNSPRTAVSHFDSTLTSTATLQMQVRDAAGNAGATDTQLVTIDTTAPGQENTNPLSPAAGNASLVLDSITSDNVINATEGAQANVAITGTARGDFTAGDIVTLTVNGKTFTGSVNAQGVFSINVPGSDLRDATTKTVSASLAAKDAAGNTGTVTDTQDYTVDTTAPTTTVDITAITNDSGVSNTDFITNDNNGLTISATLSTALATGERLFYSKDNGVTWTDITASVSNNGTGTQVSHADATLTSTATLRMQVRDAAGNAGATDTQLVTIDTTGPTQETTDPLNPSAAAGKASVILDSVTADNLVNATEGAQTNVAITGTARGDFTAGDVVTLTINGKNFTGEVAGNGRFSINVSGADLLADSDKTIDASLAARDVAGNVGTVTDTQVYTTDTTAPTTTVDITGISMDSGVSGTDFITNDNDGLTISATLSSALATGEKLFYSKDNGVTWTDITGSVSSNGTGTTVSHADATLTSTTTIQMRVQDAANNAGAADTQLITIDTSGSNNSNSNGSNITDPNATNSTVVSIDAISADSGVSTSDFITNDPTLSYSGTVSSFTANGAAVRLVLTNASGTEVGRTFVTPAANGSWTWDNTGVTRASGNYTLSATLVDAAGNTITNAVADSQIVTVDTSATQSTDNSNGSATPQTDNNSSATVSITAISTDSGVSTSDFITSDQTLSYSGTVSGFTANGAAVQLVLTDATGAVVGSTFVTPTNGAWSWDNTGVTRASGNYTLTATVVDAAGNRTNTAAAGQDTQVVTVDTSATQNTDNGSGTATPQTDPNATSSTVVSIDAISNDSGSNTTDFVTNDPTLVYSGSISGFTANGDVLQLELKNSSGNVIATQFVTPASNGAWTWDNTAVTRDNGNYTLTATLVDKAGNTVSNAVADSQPITINTAQNEAPVNTVPGAQTATEDTQLSISGISVADVDGNLATSKLTVGNGTLNVSLAGGATISAGANNSATLTLSGTPAQINAALGTVKYTGAANFNGTDTLTVLSTDSAGTPLTDSDNITITVNAVNDAPVGVADTASATEAGGVANATAGTNPSGNALTNDTNVDTGDTLTVKDIKAGTAAGAGTVVSANTTSADGTSIVGSFGTIKIGANGSYVYTVDNANATVQALSTTSTALSDVFTYTVQDSAGLTSTATITVAVNGANDAPVLANAIADTTGTDGTALSYVIPANSFSDVDNSSLTLSATLANGNALPSWLSFNASTRTFSGTPPTGTGTVSVKVTASDGTLSASDNFDIVVSAANTAPVANPTVASAASITQADTPELVITDNQSAARVANGATVTYTLTFSQAINASSLTASDISVANGTLVANSLTKVNDTTWTVQATTAATGSNATVISVADGAYTSAAGVAGLGNTGVQAYGTFGATPVGGNTVVLSSNAKLTNDSGRAMASVQQPDGSWTLFFSGFAVDGTTPALYSQKFDAAGLVQGSSTLLKTSPGLIKASDVAAFSDGSYVVIYNTIDTEFSGSIIGQRFDVAGNKVGDEFAVNAPETGGQGSVAVLSNGNFVVSWDNNSNVFARVYNAAGSPIGSQFTVGAGDDTATIALPDGGFIVNLGNGNAQRYDASATKVGGTFSIGNFVDQDTASFNDGKFVVVGMGANGAVSAQRFDADGNKLGGVISVNTTAGRQDPMVVTYADGSFVVAWERALVTPGIAAQYFDASGNKVGSEVTMVSGSSFQNRPELTALSDGGFAIEWGSNNTSTGKTDLVHKVFTKPGTIVTTGTSAAETLAGGDGNDTINVSGGGADIVSTGAGNDVVNIDNASRSALVDPNTTTMLIDGGSGINALVYTTGGAQNPTVDLTDATIAAKLRNFSTIDITGGTTAINSTLKLNHKFIANISGATDNAATKLVDESKMLVVNADTGDVVQLADLASWSVSATQSGDTLAATYGSAFKFVSGRSYKEFSLNGATLFVDSTATVSTTTSTTTAVVTGQAVSVQSLFGPSFTDVDSGQTFKGVAITNAGSSSDVSGKGQYQISADGSTWTNLAGGLTDATAIFAAPTAFIRYVGKAGVEQLAPQNLTVRLIDSSGLTGTGGTLTTGQTLVASSNGGSTAFSGNLVTLQPSINNAPVSTDADGVISGDPLGAATLVTSTFNGINSNGTFSFGANSATVTGNTGTISIANDTPSTAGGLFIGDGSVNESVNVSLSKPVSTLRIDFSGYQGDSSDAESLTVLINGAQYKLTSANLSNLSEKSTGVAKTATLDTDGVLVGTNATSLVGTITIDASTVAGGVINSFEIQDKVVRGAPNGVAVKFTLPATTSTPSQTVAQLFGSVYSDVNNDAMQGVVITSAGATGNTLGKYQWSSNGTTWTDLPAGLGDSTSVYLAKTDLIRFVPASTNASSEVKPALTARLVDDSQASGTLVSGATVNASGSNNGGTTAISGNTVGYAQVQNTAPVLADISVSLNSVASSAAPANPTGALGSLVSDLVGGVTDANSFDGKGIAISAIDTSKGSLFFSTNGGTTWTAVDTSTALSDSRAFLLKADADNRVYFKPNANFSGTVSSAFTFRAWDQTSGTEGTFVDISAANAKGGTTAFSVATDTVNQTVTTSTVELISGINGATAGDSSGQSVSYAGDVNGDGFDDVIIGAENAGGKGAAYVLFGSSAGVPDINLSSLSAGTSSSGFLISGQAAGDLAGLFVSFAGDLNNDGLADLIVGARQADPAAGTDAGRAYVVYGKTSTAVVELSAVAAGSGGFVINGASAGDIAGAVVSNAGDVNGDGFADLLLSAPKSGASAFDAGRAYVVYGSSNNTAVNLTAIANGVGGFAINGQSANDLMGLDVANAGDVNGDGLADLVVTAPLGDPAAVSNAGRSYVVFGKTNGTAVDLSAVAAGTGGFVINGRNTEERIGTAISTAGDVNGDGLADLIVGSENGQGAYVVFGKTSGSAVNLSAVFAGTGGFAINQQASGDLAGTSVSYAGDFNGDGLADLVVSSPNANLTSTTDAGRVYVVYGKTDQAAVSLSAVAAGSGGFVINGQSASDKLGGGISNSVSYAGDVNGDGYDDLIIAAPDADPVISGSTLTGAGKSYIILGGPQNITGNLATGTGTSADELVIGTSGADTLTGGGGVDRFRAGKGDDTIVLTATDVANLAATTGANRAYVDGGNGIDTLQVSASGVNLDLTAISNVSASAYDGSSRINDIERINLGADSTANTLTLAARDVNDMAGFNSFNTGNGWTNVSGTAFSGTTKFHQVVVDGTSSDTVSLKSGTGTWTNAGTVSNGTSNFVVWQNTSTNTQVIVQSGVTVNANVAPVVLDLNQDGVIDYASVVMDVNSDGVLDSTLWAGRKDGVLVWDKYHDGQVHNHTQYAFTEYGGSTDLEGLAAGFDSNHDGVLSAADDKFAEFKVWQDIDQDGVSDAGEVRSLADWGITSINLVSDGVVRTPVAGVTEAGQSSAQLADGSSVLVADAAFEFRTATAAEAASHTVAQGENVFRMFGGTSLDLSAVTDAAKLTEVNAAADTAANTIKLTLADVLGASGVNAVSGDVHQLMLTGDTNDTAVLNANEWLSTNTTVTQNDRTYAVYNAANDAAAQLLIDQQMAVAHNG